MKSHICTCCKKRRIEGKMKIVYYGMLQKYFWHCIECLSSSENINYSELISNNKYKLSSIKLTRQQIKNRISNNIKRIIKEKHTTSTKLAEILNMARANLTSQISPKNNPTIISLIKIGNTLQIYFRRFFYDYKVNSGNSSNYQIKPPEQIIIEMSKNINNIIKKQKKTKTEVANLLKMHKVNLGYKICPKNNPKINTLIDIATVLEVDCISFFK